MGLFFAETPPANYREWANSDYAFYDTLAPELHNQGVIVEPDSREPWFLCESHDAECINQTLDKFERAVDITLPKFRNSGVYGAIWDRFVHYFKERPGYTRMYVCIEPRNVRSLNVHKRLGLEKIRIEIRMFRILGIRKRWIKYF